MTQPASPTLSSSWSAARIARCLTWTYALVICAGVVVFRLPGAMVRGNEMSFERSVFTVVNAATLTGFQQAVPIDDYGPSGKVCIIALTIAGTIISLMIGGIALNRVMRLENTDAQIIWTTLFTFVFSVGIGTALMLEGSRGLLDSFFQSASALGNSGLYLGKLPDVMEWRTHAALMPLAIVGGLGVPVLLELIDLLFKRKPLSRHSRLVLAMLAGVYLLGTLALMRWSDLSSGLATASVLSVDTRTFGLPVISLQTVSRVGQWVLIVLMTVGAAPGGVAGGLRVTSLYHACCGTRRALAGASVSRSSGIAFAWIAGYMLLLFLTLLALLATLPDMAADRLALLAASALSNCGLSYEPVVLTGGGLWSVVAAMVIGRAAPLLLIWWVATTVKDTDVAV